MDSKNNKENLEPHEADKRMENMAKLAKDAEHGLEIERLRADNKKEIQKNENDRNKSKLHHSMGERIRLHQQPIKEVDQIYDAKNQKVTQKTFIFAKGIYQEHGNNASNNFSNSKLRGLLKHNFELEKNKPIKADTSLTKTFNLSKEKGILKSNFKKNKDIDMDK